MPIISSNFKIFDEVIGENKCTTILPFAHMSITSSNFISDKSIVTSHCHAGLII